MNMKSDARFIINQRRQKKPDLNTRIKRGGFVDARKILNSKLGNKSRLQVINRQRSFQTVRRPAKSFKSFNRSPEKHVKLARDGNILITANSKNTTVPSGISKFKSSQASTSSSDRWVPIDVDSADLEHVGINDVLDMDTLPSAAMGSSQKLQQRTFHKSLAEEIVGMQNTMVADQVAQQTSARVGVSNLHVSVSKQDIMELFGDVGMIKHAEMVRPGVATVEYYDPSDALKACDLYHNRLLDGQPMQCFIQQQPTSQRSLISQRLGAQIQSPSPSHFASSSRVMHNPRNVRFTVKLT